MELKIYECNACHKEIKIEMRTKDLLYFCPFCGEKRKNKIKFLDYFEFKGLKNGK